MKTIFYFILFYFLYKAITVFFRYLRSSSKNNDIRKEPRSKNNTGKSNYKDIEEASFREIKDDEDVKN